MPRVDRDFHAEDKRELVEPPPVAPRETLSVISVKSNPSPSA